MLKVCFSGGLHFKSQTKKVKYKNVIEYFLSIPQGKQTRHPFLQTVLELHFKYDKNAKDAKRLNRAVAEFICLD